MKYWRSHLMFILLQLSTHEYNTVDNRYTDDIEYYDAITVAGRARREASGVGYVRILIACVADCRV